MGYITDNKQLERLLPDDELVRASIKAYESEIRSHYPAIAEEKIAEARMLADELKKNWLETASALEQCAAQCVKPSEMDEKKKYLAEAGRFHKLAADKYDLSYLKHLKAILVAEKAKGSDGDSDDSSDEEQGSSPQSIDCLVRIVH